MTIDRRKLLELAVHVKLASEAVVAAANHLSELQPAPGTCSEAGAWHQTMDELIAMNVEIGFMERILRGALRGASETQPSASSRV